MTEPELRAEPQAWGSSGCSGPRPAQPKNPQGLKPSPCTRHCSRPCKLLAAFKQRRERPLQHLLGLSNPPAEALGRRQPLPTARPAPPRGLCPYLYTIPACAWTLSRSDSPWRCRNLSSCLRSLAPLALPAPAVGWSLGATLVFLPRSGASLAFCRAGLWVGMSAQEGLYKCMAPHRAAALPFVLLQGERSNSSGLRLGAQCCLPITGERSEGRGLPVGTECRPCFPGLIFREWEIFVWDSTQGQQTSKRIFSQGLFEALGGEMSAASVSYMAPSNLMGSPTLM